MSQNLTQQSERRLGTKQIVVDGEVIFAHTGEDGDLEALVTIGKFHRKLAEI
jgi:hypothetical protein